MGEVYRARDTKLNRDVAVKVLRAAVAGDPERLARFQREAHVLASLNHPNIAQIYGLEDSGAVHGLVMELVAAPVRRHAGWQAVRRRARGGRETRSAGRVATARHAQCHRRIEKALIPNCR
jgi:hypothetical protein